MNTAFETSRSAAPTPTAARVNVVNALRRRLATISLSPGLQRAIQLARQRRPTGEVFETSKPPAKPIDKKAMLLSLKIPEAPYSDTLMVWLHRIFDIIEGVDVVVTALEVELVGWIGAAAAAGLGVATGVAAPVAGLLATMMALGSGYAEARKKIANERIRFGFALGVVLGADGRSWKYTKGMFWEWAPESNPADQEAGRIAQRMFNLGLATGFVQGRRLSKLQRSFFWRSLGATMTAGDKSRFAGDSKQWPEPIWIEWYIWAAAGFLKLYAKG